MNQDHPREFETAENYRDGRTGHAVSPPGRRKLPKPGASSAMRERATRQEDDQAEDTELLRLLREGPDGPPGGVDFPDDAPPS